VTYMTQALLGDDWGFSRRMTSCVLEQSRVFIDDERPDMVATATSCLRAEGGPTAAFIRLGAAAPGLADMVQLPDGEGIDSGRITDADLLAFVQAAYPLIAALYFNSDGTPRERNAL
jgi:hypothetical protein